MPDTTGHLGADDHTLGRLRHPMSLVAIAIMQLLAFASFSEYFQGLIASRPSAFKFPSAIKFSRSSGEHNMAIEKTEQYPIRCNLKIDAQLKV